MSERRQVNRERRRAVLWDVYHDTGAAQVVDRIVKESDQHSDDDLYRGMYD